jgi:hypothetical protein
MKGQAQSGILLFNLNIAEQGVIIVPQDPLKEF